MSACSAVRWPWAPLLYSVVLTEGLGYALAGHVHPLGPYGNSVHACTPTHAHRHSHTWVTSAEGLVCFKCPSALQRHSESMGK